MTTAREYLRISEDRSGRQRSIDEQHEQNELVAAGRSVTLGVPYQDDTSASRYARKARDGFPLLLADIQGKRFGADELWLWESSRGSRRVREWLDLIDLCASAKILIYVTTHNRTYDPSNGRDRRSLLEDAVDAEYESSKSSDRIRRATAASAALGRPHGKVPFGYRRTYNPSTGKMTGQVPEPAEAATVKRLFKMLEAGYTLVRIARDFEKDGLKSRKGATFTPQHLRSIALNGTYAAIRVHAPKVTRHPSVRALPGPGVSMTEGDWTPLVSRTTYHAVVALLTDPARVTRKPGGAKHLVSGIGVCDVCGLFLSATGRVKIGPAYQCTAGCVVVRQEALDDIVTGVIIEYLSRKDVRAGLIAASADTPSLAAARDALADARTRLQSVYASAASADGISPAALAAIEPRLLAEINGLERQVTSLASPPVLLQFIEAGVDSAKRWGDAPVSARRDVARFLLAPEHLGQLRIMRRPADWPPFTSLPVEDRIRWVRTQAEV